MLDSANNNDVSRRTVLKSGAIASGAVLLGTTGAVAAQGPIEGTLWAINERPDPGTKFELRSNQGGGSGNDGCIAGQTEEWITSLDGWWPPEEDGGNAIAHLRTVRDFKEGETLEIVQTGGECEAANQEAPPQLVIVVERTGE